MRNKRRTRGSAAGRRRRPRPGYTPLIFLLCLSVGCGYIAAKYVVEPAVNYVPQITQKAEKQETSGDEETTESGETIEDEVKVENAAKVKGYALQFGCYSEKDSADKAMSKLDMSGLSVREQDGLYKIVGDVYETKDEAHTALTKLPDGTGAFVTEIYE